MSGAGEQLQAAAMTALRGIEGLGVFEPAPVQAALPYATVEAGPESDWGHKSGAGRQVRIAITIRDEGERPVRLRRLAGETEAALAGMNPELAGWRVVTMTLLRTFTVREPRGGPWAAVIEYRTRMLQA